MKDGSMDELDAAEQNLEKTSWKSRRFARLNERGFVMAWVGLMLTLLMGFAGFSVDLGNWYLHVQRAQRAADAAALAADVHMPYDYAKAVSVARDTLRRNDVPEADVMSAYIAPVPGRPAQIEVRVGTTTQNYFVQLLGLNSTQHFVRGATAEHLAQLQINSGQNGLGGPEVPAYNNKVCSTTSCWTTGSPTNANYWLQMAGTDTNKIEGDRFSSSPCSTDYPQPVSSAHGNYYPSGCGGSGSTGYNAERATQAEDKYNYELRLTPTAALGTTSTWLIIQAYDPQFNDNPGCSPYDDAHPAPECPNDETYRETWNFPKTVVGSNEPWSYFNLYKNAQATSEMPGSTCRDSSNGFAPTNQKLTANYVWPSWQEVCRIKVDPTKPQSLTLRAWMGAGVGTNHFMLRASYSASGGAPTASEINVSKSVINMSAYKNFGVYTATRGDSQFKLAQVGSEWAGRQIKVEIFDAADNYVCCKAWSGKNYYYGTTAGPIVFSGDTVGPRNYLPGNCYATQPGTGANGPTYSATTGSSGCGFMGTQPNFKGQASSLIWNVPTNYNCTPSGPNNCWLYIRMEYAAYIGATALLDDDTTWTMWQPGETLRLVK